MLKIKALLGKILNKLNSIGSISTILAWGTYNAIGDYNLSKPYTDFTWLRFRLGAATDNASGGGAQNAYFPVEDISIGSDKLYGVNYYLNGNWYNIMFSFKSATVIHIQTVYNITGKNTSMMSGIRQIDGVY